MKDWLLVPRLDEFALIRLLTERGKRANADDESNGDERNARAGKPGLVVGIGDDAAVADWPAGMQLVMSCDTMVDQVHFHRYTMRLEHIGFKALASNVSDMCAMGAVPLYALVALAVPPDYEADRLRRIYDGLCECAREYGVQIAGGDTTSTPGVLTISVTIIGMVEEGQALLRSTAQVGDAIFVTGYPGCSAAGLHVLLERGQDAEGEAIGEASEAEAVGVEWHDEASETIGTIGSTGTAGESEAGAAQLSIGRWSDLVREHQRPRPSVRAGRLLVQSGCCHALNDISDGLASELWEIAEASGVGIMLDGGRIPLRNDLVACAREAGIEPLQWVLYGGEDYRLVGTIPASEASRMESLFDREGLAFHVIGTVEEQVNGVRLRRTDGTIERIDKKGYNHFPEQNG